MMLLSSAAWAEETLKIQSVDVAGARDETEMRKDAATQKVVFGRKEIENLSVMTVSEVLGKLPGVEVGSGGARARGMSRDSIRVLIDGERQSGGTMGPSPGCRPATSNGLRSTVAPLQSTAARRHSP